MADEPVMDVTQPIARYDGNNITCYPGSNQKDDGKLQLEFNMARLVTRVTSKNFCIIKPCFVLSSTIDQYTNLPQIEVSPGQCSINGMDIIANETLRIDPPNDPGHFYLAFHLARDSSSNVLGDLIYGVTTTFEGLYLTWYDNKPDPVPADMFYLGEVDWDGTRFYNLEEDEDKYGRIWAEDVLGKFMDPKHPDVRRLNLQEWIYKVPDWYFSKEGDTVYGPVVINCDREDNNTGIILNVDDTGSHITIKDPFKENNLLQFYGDVDRDGDITQADVDIIQAYIDDPDNNPLTYLQFRLADVNHDGVVDAKDIKYIKNFINREGNYGDTGNIYYIDDSVKMINFNVDTEGNYRFELAKMDMFESEDDDILHLHNDGDMCVDIEGWIKVEADENIDISTELATSPNVNINDTTVNITDPKTPDLQFYWEMFEDSTTNNEIARFVQGRSRWEYDYTTKTLSLYRTDLVNQDNTWYLDIYPDVDMKRYARVQERLLLGNFTNYATETTFLSATMWQLSNEPTDNMKNFTRWTPTTMSMINPNGNGTSYIYVGKGTGNGSGQGGVSYGIIYSKINDDGSIEIQNNTTTTPKLIFKDSVDSRTIYIEKVFGEKKLNITGHLHVESTIVADGSITGCGLYTTNGELTFINGTNNATIIKKSGSSDLYMNEDVHIGDGVGQTLYAGRGVFSGIYDDPNYNLGMGLGVGGSTYQLCPLKIDGKGNILTTGWIRGSKVYNACYNGVGEIFRKDKDEDIDYGDVVCIREDGLVHKVQMVEDIQTIIGICSDTIGVELGGEGIPEDEQVEVEMMGKIWVKTDNNYITPGKLIKPTADGKVDITTNKAESIGITLTNTKDGKVRIVYNGI